MHVSACILLLPPLTIGPIACKFVYVCTCTYWWYLYVFDVYARIVLVYACISWNHTSRHGKRCHVPEAQSLGAAIGGAHSGHPWASEHPLFFALGKCCSDPIWRTPPRGTRPGPLKRPCRWPLGGLQCTIRALQSSPVACHSRSGRLEHIQPPEGAGRHPSKTPPNCNSPMSVCQYMYVYVCIYSICKYTYVYVCIFDLA